MNKGSKKYPVNNDEESLIIHHPESMGNLRRGTEWSLTFVGWAIWAFLCRPAVLLFLWSIGFEFFYEHMIRLGGVKGLREYALFYAFGIFLMYVVIRGWNFYNERRFRNQSRRTSKATVTPADLDAFFQLPPESAQAIQLLDYAEVTFPAGQRIKIHTDHTADHLPAYDGRFTPS